MRNAGRTVSKERLLSSVWGYHFDPGSNVVDVYVRRLRAKLGATVIATDRGVGYRDRCGMTASEWPNRVRWFDVAWVLFSLANLAAMLLVPEWETVPFHFIWVSLTILYGFRVWQNLADDRGPRARDGDDRRR